MKEQKKTSALGGRRWAALLIFGLFGQLAWTIENMYFNVFVYNTISTDPGVIADMVAWSAVTATDVYKRQDENQSRLLLDAEIRERWMKAELIPPLVQKKESSGAGTDL